MDHLNKHNRHHGKPLFKNLQEAVIRIMEEEEDDAKNNVNNVTKDTSFQSPVSVSAQNKYANITYERRMESGILAETIK